MQANEMADFLGRGFGRVCVFLQELSQNGGDTSAFRDVISYALLHDTRYDKQCELCRAMYLCDVVRATGEPNFYGARLCEALLTPAGDKRDEEQRCALAALLAANEPVLRRALYAAFERGVRAGSPVATEALINLDGAAGFLHAAQWYHDFPPPDDALWWRVDILVDKLGGPEAVRQAFDQMEADAPSLAPYLQAGRQEWEAVQSGTVYEKAEQERRKKREAGTPRTYEEIETALDKMVRANEKWYYPLVRIGRDATSETVLRFAHDVQAGAAGERLIALLRLFAKRPFPLAPNVLLPLTTHKNERIAYAAIQSLRRTIHPDVRAQGLHFLKIGRVSEGIKLLVKNPDGSDHTLFAAPFQKLTDKDELHHAGMALRDYYEANPSPDLLPVLRLLYEKGPCSMCRGMVVDFLIQADALPEALRVECAFDANLNTRHSVAA